MRIVVCIKQVPDPEGPRDAYVVNEAAGTVEPRGIPPVLSLFDENALEVALRLKDVHSTATVTALSVGRRIANAVMLKALAVGADELVKVEDEALDAAHVDSFATAQVLAAALRRLPFDLVLVGRQAADWNDGQVGIGIAHLLDIPAVTLARAVTVADRELTVERVVSGGYERVHTTLPALIMVGNEGGELRYPSMIQRREAKNKPVTAWDLPEIGLAAPPVGRVQRQRLYAAELKPRACRIFNGASPAEAGRSLARQLREDKII